MTSIRNYSSSTVQSIQGELNTNAVAKATDPADKQATTSADSSQSSATGEAGQLYTGGVAETVQAYNISTKSVTSGASIADLGKVSLSSSDSSAVDGDTGLGVIVTRSGATRSSAVAQQSSASRTSRSTSGAGSTTSTTSSARLATTREAQTASLTSTDGTTATSTDKTTSSVSSDYTEINESWIALQTAMSEAKDNLSDLRKQIKTTWSNLRKKSEKIVEAQDSLNNVKSRKGNGDDQERAKWRNTIAELKKDVKELVETLDNLQESLKEGVANLKSLSDQGKELKEQTEALEEQAAEEYADGTIDKATYQKVEKLNSSMEGDLSDADEAIETYQELADANEFDADALYSACAETYDSYLNDDETTLWTSGGSYDVSDSGSNVVAFMDYLDSYEAAVDTGSDTKGIASDRYEGKLKT